MSDDHADLTRRIADLTPERAQLYAYDCALRIRPVVAVCAGPDSAAAYERGLAAVRSGLPPDDRALSAAELEDAPEQEAESADEKGYWAYTCLQVLAAALTLPETADPTAAANGVCGLALALHADLDYDLEHGHDLEHDARHDAPATVRTGVLKSADVAAQHAAIDAVAADIPRDVALALLAGPAEAHAAMLAEILPPLAADWA